MGFDQVAIARYPQVERIHHVHHAGNSSGIVDGTAAILIGSEAAGKTHNLKPRARILAAALSGANQFLSVLEQSHMLPKLQQTKLQNAIVNAMYAATLESELGTEAAMQIIGAGSQEATQSLAGYMMAVNNFHSGSQLRLNGVKIPHLWPGEKLNLQTSGNVDNGFTDLESSILRWMAAGLNVPYEPF
eukprot:gene11965-14631_t